MPDVQDYAAHPDGPFEGLRSYIRSEIARLEWMIGGVAPPQSSVQASVDTAGVGDARVGPPQPIADNVDTASLLAAERVMPTEVTEALGAEAVVAGETTPAATAAPETHD